MIKLVSAIGMGFRIAVRQDFPAKALGDIRSLRCFSEWSIDTFPYDTMSLLRLRSLHIAIHKNEWMDRLKDSRVVDLLFGLPEPIYQWYRGHTFDELIAQWVEAAAFNINTQSVDRDICISQTPPTLVDSLLTRVDELRLKKSPRKRFPKWLNFRDYRGNYKWFVRDHTSFCPFWGVRSGDLHDLDNDSVSGKYEADRDAFEYFKFNQEGDVWPEASIKPPPKPPGYIYIMTDGQYFKIGYSGSDPRSRLLGCQTGNASQLSLVGFIPWSIQKEKILHKIHRDKKIRGEWFNLTDDDVAEILKK